MAEFDRFFAESVHSSNRTDPTRLELVLDVGAEAVARDLAAAAGVNAQTLRYYERRGLPAEPDRSLGGHRLYPEQAVTAAKSPLARSRSTTAWAIAASNGAVAP
ncbi:MerR family DNA-binding transcriptional regulator [Nocardia sp. NPDC058379]|uniref:MerR family DNA-binding transcriptional regulator n=1 Tax=unclassified Nocardia TaxID=2637762 RepID=UPI00366632B5